MACLADVTKGTSNFKLGVIDGAGYVKNSQKGVTGRQNNKENNVNGNKFIPAIGNTGKCIVPGQKGCDHTEATASLGEGVVHLSVPVRVRVVGAGKHEEAEVEGEEEEEEHDGRTQCAQEEDCRKDEPACEEEAHGRLVHHGIRGGDGISLVRALLAKDVPVRSEQEAPSNPETTIG